MKITHPGQWPALINFQTNKTYQVSVKSAKGETEPVCCKDNNHDLLAIKSCPGTWKWCLQYAL